MRIALRSGIKKINEGKSTRGGSGWTASGQIWGAVVLLAEDTRRSIRELTQVQVSSELMNSGEADRLF